MFSFRHLVIVFIILLMPFALYLDPGFDRNWHYIKRYYWQIFSPVTWPIGVLLFTPFFFASKYWLKKGHFLAFILLCFTGFAVTNYFFLLGVQDEFSALVRWFITFSS